MFEAGDFIKLRMVSNDTVVSGMIQAISDSAILIHTVEVSIKDISEIYRNRWGFSLLQKLSLATGILYVSFNTLNGLINNDKPIVPKETLVISGVLIAGGVALSPLTTRKCKVLNGNWTVKILDYTDDK